MAEPDATPPAAAIALPSCPYCAFLLDPPPARGRLCPRCRQRIVVRHLAGRAIYLTEAAVPVFDNERRRTDDQLRWTAERRRWLHLAKGVKVPADRRARVERAPLSAEAVRAARTLYLSAVEREVRTARGARRWSDVAALRREQAAALFEEAGSPVPPPEDIVRLHQEGATAALRAMADIARQADLVGAGCCAACRADDGRTFRITDEIRVPRLPHRGCPRGLCACDWWISTEAPKRRRRVAAKRDNAAADGEPAAEGESTEVEASARDASAEAREDSAGEDDGTDDVDEAGALDESDALDEAGALDESDALDGDDGDANTPDGPAGPEEGPELAPHPRPPEAQDQRMPVS